MVFLLSLIRPIHSTGVMQAKLDISSFSDAWKNSIEYQLRIYAYYEADLEYCGYHPDLERRAVAAVQSCLTPETISTITTYYRERKALSTRVIADHVLAPGDVKVDCGDKLQSEMRPKTLKSMYAKIDKLADLCRKCTFC
jgi:hypothetical protein